MELGRHGARVAAAPRDSELTSPSLLQAFPTARTSRPSTSTAASISRIRASPSSTAAKTVRSGLSSFASFFAHQARSRRPQPGSTPRHTRLSLRTMATAARPPPSRSSSSRACVLPSFRFLPSPYSLSTLACTQGVHHWDENGRPSPPEPEEIQRVHREEVEFVRAWLEEWREEQRDKESRTARGLIS